MKYELLIVGAGISGMAAALEARKCGIDNVLIVDYEEKAGGFAKDLFDTDEFAQEKEMMAQAAELPYEFRYRTTVVGLYPGENENPHQVNLQSPVGSEDIEAERILLCSGSLEKPREAHLVPGSRPAGIMTPIMAAQMLRRGYIPGNRIIAFGRGRLVKSAVRLLEQYNCRTEWVDVDEWQITRIVGHRRIEKIALRHRKTSEERVAELDTLIFCDGRIPCTFYLKGGDIMRDDHHAIVVDEAGRTNIPRISAAGSCTTRGDDEHLTSAERGRLALQGLFN